MLRTNLRSSWARSARLLPTTRSVVGASAPRALQGSLAFNQSVAGSYAVQLSAAPFLDINDKVASRHEAEQAQDLTQTQGQHCYLDMYLKPEDTPSIVWLHQTVQDRIEAAGPTIVHRHLSEHATGFSVDFLLDESHTSVSMHKDGSFSMDCFTCGDSNPQNILSSVMRDVVENFPLASADGAKYNWVRRFYDSKTSLTVGLDEQKKSSTKSMHSFFDITNFNPVSQQTLSQPAAAAAAAAVS